MNTNQGINAGLQLWLTFLIIFALLGYSALMCLVMGAIAGFASGYIIYWLRGTFPTDDISPASENNNGSIITRAREGLNRISWNNNSAESKEGEAKKEAPLPWIARFRRRKPRRSFRSRR